MQQQLSYFMVNKPYGMLSQFTREGKWNALCDLNYTFAKDVYPVGRLDADSEGLLLLTNDTRLNALLLQPKQHIAKTYLAQVEGLATPQAIHTLCTSVTFTNNNAPHSARATHASIVTQPNYITERSTPILAKRFPTTSWITLTIDEGKNRQVRKMTAAVGLPTLRLIRIELGTFTLQNFITNTVTPLTLVQVKSAFNLTQL
ncbi:MAG: pseudouridine synthase [Bacteroidia bacterium]